jgi:hypothetical protein
MENSFDKKDFKRIAKQKLAEGISKQNIYDEAITEGHPPKQVADILVDLPTKERWKKYGIWNTVFLILLILVALANLIQPSLALLVNIGLIYLVAAKKFQLYYFHVVVGVWGFVSLIATFLAYSNVTPTNLAIAVGTSILFIIPGVFLPKMLAPKYTLENEIYYNEEGNSRLTNKHVFVD